MLFNLVQFEMIKSGNTQIIKDVVYEAFNIKCKKVILNTDFEQSEIGNRFFGIMVRPKFNQALIRNLYNCVVADLDKDTTIVLDGVDIEIDVRIFSILTCEEFNEYIKYEIVKYTSCKATLNNFYDHITVYASRKYIDIKPSNRFEVNNIYYSIAVLYLMKYMTLSNVDEFKDIENGDIYYGNVDLTVLKTVHYKMTPYLSNMSAVGQYADIILSTFSDLDRYARFTSELLTNMLVTINSKLEYETVNSIINNLKNINGNDFLNEGAILEGYFGGLHKSFRMSGAKKIEEDYYKLTVEVKSIRDKEDALAALRELNSNIRLLESILSRTNLSEFEIDRYDNLKVKYMDLRDQVLANKNLEKVTKIITLSDILKADFTI